MGSIGVGGPATAAEINGACALAFDCAGNLYLTNSNNNRVSKITYDVPPAFTGGHSQNITVCEDTTLAPINVLLAVTDTDAGKMETWSVVAAPVHGTVAGSYVTTSTGGTLMPTGLSYTPASGYTGSDSFRVQVTDCSPGYTTAIYTTTIYVMVKNCDLALPLPPQAETGLSVFPNPNGGAFTVKVSSDNNEEVFISITNVIGEKVKQLFMSTNQPTVITADAPAGVYFLSAITKDGGYNAKVVVTK
jgi:hypothetical protein